MRKALNFQGRLHRHLRSSGKNTISTGKPMSEGKGYKGTYENYMAW